MKKRVVAGLLWTWMTWTIVLMMNGLFGVSVQVGFVLAVAIGAFVGGDPMHRIWPRPETQRPGAVPSFETDLA